MKRQEACLVLDIGKTNVKLHSLSAGGETIVSTSLPNRVVPSGPYPHADLATIDAWLIDAMQTQTRECRNAGCEVDSIAITTHGATAALIDASRETDAALVMPVLDYESPLAEEANRDYAAVRPKFSETCSPSLPAGLNLGRQLFWQQQRFADDFARVTHILMYPQYWAWRLSGALCNEVSSLGCHTDVWCPEASTYSSLVAQMNWQSRLPPLRKAWEAVGRLRPELAAKTGLNVSCAVYAGVHDSNASLVRYLRAKGKRTVISTGTWTIAMALGGEVGVLNENRDMLANVDVRGHPVACSRFMGGREYEAICQRLGAGIDLDVSAEQVERILSLGAMALPDFSGGSGPFGGHTPSILKADTIEPRDSAALATLYCALMINTQLEDLHAEGDVIIEGAFLANPVLCQLLATIQARPVWTSTDGTGTVQGCAQLARWRDGIGTTSFAPALERVSASSFEGLEAYRDQWRLQARGASDH